MQVVPDWESARKILNQPNDFDELIVAGAAHYRGSNEMGSHGTAFSLVDIGTAFNQTGNTSEIAIPRGAKELGACGNAQCSKQI